MSSQIKIIILIVCLGFGLTTNATASSQGEAEPNFDVNRVVDFAKKVEKTIAEKGARVFILSRVGRPKKDLPSGIEYTHVAFGVYSIITTDAGDKIPGYAIYNLYQRADKPNKSHLVVDFPVEFFMGVHELRAGIIIPKPEVQRRLLEVINSDTYKALHNPKYSVISNPYNRRFQNCTEHTLDVITASIYKTEDHDEIKSSLNAYFDAQKIKINPFKLMLGSIVKPDVSVADHGGKGISTSTYTTITKFMQKYELAQEVITISEDVGA